MDELISNNEQGSRERRLLGLGVFLALASIGFLFLFGFLIRPVSRSFVWEMLASFTGLIIGGILIATMLGRLRGKSSILPAGISLLCAIFLTVGAGFGYVATCNWEGRPNPMNSVFSVLGVLGATLFVFAALWLFVAVIVRAVRIAPREQGK